MARLRAASWALAIGVLSVVLAATLFRLAGAPGAVFAVLLIWCAGLVSLLAGLIAEISPSTGAAGGAFAAGLVAAVLGMTIAAAPLAPGARRPGFADLLWAPLFALLGVVAFCALAGWAGVRGGVRVARWRRSDPR
jgi:hypothetical protein